jgi:hypothetical protein
VRDTAHRLKLEHKVKRSRLLEHEYGPYSTYPQQTQLLGGKAILLAPERATKEVLLLMPPSPQDI